MQLWCHKCHRLTEHGELTDHGDGLIPPGPPSRLITARCECGYRNNKLKGYVVTEANLARETRHEQLHEPALSD